MLTLNLTPIFKARNIVKPYSFLIKAGFTAHTATDIANGQKTAYSLAHIELLCRALYCTPNDLFLWKETKDEPLAPGHPLREVTGFAEDANALMDQLHTLSPAALSRLAKQLKRGNEEEGE